MGGLEDCQGYEDREICCEGVLGTPFYLAKGYWQENVNLRCYFYGQ